MGGNGSGRSNGSSERNENKEGPEETLRVSRSIDVGGSCLKIRWFAGDLARMLRYGFTFNFKGKFAFSMPMPNHSIPYLPSDSAISLDGLVNLVVGGYLCPRVYIRALLCTFLRL